ncbi:MAG TPA: pyridoxal-phosphate dependent enzyme [Candidatus Limnocylindrales bacterium]
MIELPVLPRVGLLDGPTPLQPLERLSAALGDRAELWIKREDLGPLAFFGNKLRNLEFLLGAAIDAGADTIVTSGRRWSNHCRLTAAAGAKLGLRVEIVVSGPTATESANLALIEMLGATVHQAATASRSDREALVARVAGEETAGGRRVHVIPVGGSDATGAWGQVLGGLEVLEQAAARGFVPDVIVLPSATGGTQAGLIVGASIRALDAGASPTRIVGVAVAHPEAELRPHVEALVRELATLAGIPAPLDAIEIDASQLGDGYGIPSAASNDGCWPAPRASWSIPCTRPRAWPASSAWFSQASSTTGGPCSGTAADCLRCSRLSNPPERPEPGPRPYHRRDADRYPGDARRRVL